MFELFILKTTTGDGHCLFQSLAVPERCDESQHTALRKRAV